MKPVFNSAFLLSPLALAISLSAHAETETKELDAVTVTADFRQTEVQSIPEAVTVVGEAQIEQRNAEHLEQILSFAPNVNYSSGSSRSRFYQIRGIGERSQFIDPVNPSVGLMIDGIDMTGLGGAATLLDVEQVEILRGPQGTRFGANALAGMINIRSAAPTKNTEGYVKGKFGNYGSHGQSGAISGSLADNVQGRLAVSSFKTDGYINNTHLDRKNTNNIDEVVARGKLAAQLAEDTEINFSYFYADIDNGYDAFSLDFNRKTLSDEPGVDTQDTHAFAIDLNHKISEAAQLKIIASSSKSDVEYRFDEDWAFGKYIYNSDDPTYVPDPCDTAKGPCLAAVDGYSSVDQYLRKYERSAIDVRLLSGANGRIWADTTDWTVGIYHQQRSEALTRNVNFKSDLDVVTTSLYGELNTTISADTTLTYGLRAERWNNDFTNSNNINSDETDTLIGGKVLLESLVALNHLTYASIARGYKPAGANSSDKIGEDNRLFDAEFNNTLELGVKSSLLDNNLRTRVAAFYIQRKDQQVKQSFAGKKSDGSPKFTDFIANAAEGKNQGVEIESQWQLTPELRWDLSLGYLDTEFVDYEFNAKDKKDPSKIIVKDGRAQALAPEYSAATALAFQFLPGMTFTLESEAKDKFFFSDSHDNESKAYVLWHARLAYKVGPVSAALYGRNLTGREVETRGFAFGNDPRNNYAESRYVQLGEPRLFGIEGKYSF
jgi:outer membrane receptor protein involved in Fe transport